MRGWRAVRETSAKRNFEPGGRYNRSDGVESHRFSGACVTPRLQQRNIGARETGGIKSRNTKPCRFQCISVLNKRLFALPRYSSWPRIMPPADAGSGLIFVENEGLTALATIMPPTFVGSNSALLPSSPCGLRRDRLARQLPICRR